MQLWSFFGWESKLLPVNTIKFRTMLWNRINAYSSKFGIFEVLLRLHRKNVDHILTVTTSELAPSSVWLVPS